MQIISDSIDQEEGIRMETLYEQYILNQDRDIFRYQWSSYNQAAMENKLEQIKKEIYEKICKELSDEHIEKQ